MVNALAWDGGTKKILRWRPTDWDYWEVEGPLSPTPTAYHGCSRMRWRPAPALSPFPPTSIKSLCLRWQCFRTQAATCSVAASPQEAQVMLLLGELGEHPNPSNPVPENRAWTSVLPSVRQSIHAFRKNVK